MLLYISMISVAISVLIKPGQLQVPQSGLFFMLRGKVYLNGENVFMNEVGVFTGASLTGTGTSLVCITSNVNMQCCRTRDGGNVGEWFFPNGTIVPRNSVGGPFTRSGFTHQVRLNRYHGASTPAGEFTCKVPDDQSGIEHSASVTLLFEEVSVPGSLFVSERDGVVSVCAVLAISPANSTSHAIAITLSTSDITASAISDYIAESETFTFPADSTNGATRCLDIDIINDGGASEVDETFSVILTTEDNIFLGGMTTIVTITPDTGLFFFLGGTIYLPDESVIITDIGDNTSALVCATDNVNTHCCGNGAMISDLRAEWLFPDGSQVPISSDGISSDYATSSFPHQLRLSRVNETARVGSFRCRVQDEGDSMFIHDANITLIDVDLSIPTALIVDEADGAIAVCAILSIAPATATLSQNLSASLATKYTHSATPGLDYTPVSRQLTFHAGSENGSIQCLEVNITNDEVVLEIGETFDVTLVTTDSMILGGRRTAVTIRDNVPRVGLYFSLNGILYIPGGKLPLSDVGLSLYEDPGFSLVCVTSNVNTQCCRTQDGGNVGEWFFPNGTMVPRNRGNGDSEFTRSGYTQQIRLNRRRIIHDKSPTGNFTCRVPDELANSGYHEAVIILLARMKTPVLQVLILLTITFIAKSLTLSLVGPLEANLGDPLEIVCVASGPVASTISILEGNTPITGEFTQTNLNSSVRAFSKASTERSDNGRKLACQVGDLVTPLMTVTIIYFDSIELMPVFNNSSLVLTEGSNVDVIRYEIMASPRADITLTRTDGMPPSSRFWLSQRALSISGVSRADTGSYNLTFIHQASSGVMFYKFSLEVEYIVRIVSRPQDTTVEEGSSAVFECRFNGTKEVPSWIINGSLLGGGQQLPERHSFRSGILTVSNVSASDNGTLYECILGDFDGGNATLTVLAGHPQISGASDLTTNRQIITSQQTSLIIIVSSSIFFALGLVSLLCALIIVVTALTCWRRKNRKNNASVDQGTSQAQMQSENQTYSEIGPPLTSTAVPAGTLPALDAAEDHEECDLTPCPAYATTCAMTEESFYRVEYEVVDIHQASSPVISSSLIKRGDLECEFTSCPTYNVPAAMSSKGVEYEEIDEVAKRSTETML